VTLFEEVGGCGLVHGRPLVILGCHARESGHPVIAGSGLNPEAAAYWIVRSSRTMTSVFVARR
jgi:hypothetical protein